MPKLSCFIFSAMSWFFINSLSNPAAEATPTLVDRAAALSYRLRDKCFIIINIQTIAIRWNIDSKTLSNIVTMNIRHLL